LQVIAKGWGWPPKHRQLVFEPCAKRLLRNRNQADSIGRKIKLGFTGVKMIRRILGLVHVEELEAILDPDLSAHWECKALRIDRLLVINAQSFAKIGEVTAAPPEEYSDNEG
jgi:5-methylthioribose kinase